MAYEKLLNEIYAAISLKYLWKGYKPYFIKSESPDWVNPALNMGMEVSQALLPDDGQTKSFIEQFLGCTREELPQSAIERYGERMHFYNGRFWAILPENEGAEDYAYKTKVRFDCKLKKLNSNFKQYEQNALYLFVHPKKGSEVDIDSLFSYMVQKQAPEKVHFDWAFLNCGNVIYVCNLKEEKLSRISLPENAEHYLSEEAEILRHSRRWKNGDAIE